MYKRQLPAQATPFDVLIINVCSLAWRDVEASGLTGHPVWSHFDIRFNRFNSATSYSGPSSIRLLRASCGQTSHQGLYVTAPKQCLLFENLAQLGFAKQVAMDHSGDFGNYLTGLQQYAGLDVTPMDKKGLAHDLSLIHILRDPLLSPAQKSHALALAAENALPYPELPADVAEAMTQGVLCDMFEGHAPYKPRYVLPDYAR